MRCQMLQWPDGSTGSSHRPCPSWHRKPKPTTYAAQPESSSVGRTTAQASVSRISVRHQAAQVHVLWHKRRRAHAGMAPVMPGYCRPVSNCTPADADPSRDAVSSAAKAAAARRVCAMLWLSCTGMQSIMHCSNSAAAVAAHRSRLRQLRRSLLARLGHVQMPLGGRGMAATPQELCRLAACLDHIVVSRAAR